MLYNTAVFMYINDVEEGGCTVFKKVDSPNPTQPSQYAVDMFEENSREADVLDHCHTKLTVPPKQGTAALFYSVRSDGMVDAMAVHGACPVIKGIKWGANIWIWNRQRYGAIKTGDKRTLKIKNSLDEEVYITWEGSDNGILAPRKQRGIGSFEHHRFRAYRGSYKGELIDEFTVQSEPKMQLWIIRPLDDYPSSKDLPSQGTSRAVGEL